MQWTSAAVSRAVSAALAPALKKRLPIAGYEVTFNQGVPTVRVTLGPESPTPAPVETGGENVEAMRIRLKGLRRG